MALLKTIANCFKKAPPVDDRDRIRLTDYQKQLLNRMRNMPQKKSPRGWEISVQKMVGGLRHIGFSEKQPGKLLVISVAGKSIIDGYGGQMLFRDPDDNNYDYVKLTSEGVADLKGETIRLAGITGGGLPIVNADGDFIRRCAPDYPEEIFIFEPTGRSIFYYDSFKQRGCYIIYSPVSETVAYGFSPRGDLLVIADTATLMIWKKKR